MRPTPSDGARADDSANRDQNARPSGSFFGESLDGLVQVGAALRGRGALWHCCPPERAAERDRSSARGADRVGQDRDAAVAQPGPAGTRRPRGPSGPARRQSQGRGAHPADPRRLRHRQTLRREDAIPGAGARRQHRRDRRRLLAVPGGRGGERGQRDRAPDEHPLLAGGARLRQRERRIEGRDGGGRRGLRWPRRLGGRPGRRPECSSMPTCWPPGAPS